jgi:hypothetical protein
MVTQTVLRSDPVERDCNAPLPGSLALPAGPDPGADTCRIIELLIGIHSTSPAVGPATRRLMVHFLLHSPNLEL